MLLYREAINIKIYKWKTKTNKSKRLGVLTTRYYNN